MDRVYWTYEKTAAVLKDEPYVDHMSAELSEDGVDDVAMWVVAQGKEEYERIIADPRLTPRRVEKKTGVLGDVVLEYDPGSG